MNKEEFPDGKIRFEIEELGPIRDSIIDFKPFLLFSGESNTGKSYTAMALYYLLYILTDNKIMLDLIRELFDTKKIEKKMKPRQEIQLEFPEGFLGKLEKLYNENIDRFLAYMLGHEGFSCKVKLALDFNQLSKSKYTVFWDKKENSTALKIKFHSPSYDYEYGIHSASKFNIDYVLLFFVQGLCKELFFKDDQKTNFFLPPARGAFGGLTMSMWEKFSGIGMYKEYLYGMDSVKYLDAFFINEKLEKRKNTLKQLFARLLNGDIKIERDNETYTVAGSGIEMPLTAASSSVKEMSPLHRILKRVDIHKLSICIEEPEAHLHPDLQRGVAQLLSFIVNGGGFVQATTHSDFFMNQVNNLVKLHFIKNKDHKKFKEALKETGIAEEFVLDPVNIAPYYFEKNKKGVHVKKLEISDKGMPMESFEKTYEKSTKETRYLREALSDDDE